ncbi:hypothetical protein CsSME_00007257 [Camellia sinensis var. sinensis]
MSSMAWNQVWELVDLLSGRMTVDNKWVLKIKHKADGLIDKYKACLVAKGYNQREGIDYDKTFSLVTWINFFLGVKILRDHSKRLLDLSQETYIKRISERFCMHYSKPIDTPIEKGR